MNRNVFRFDLNSREQKVVTSQKENMTLHAAMIARVRKKILVNIHIYAYYANIFDINIQCYE